MNSVTIMTKIIFIFFSQTMTKNMPQLHHKIATEGKILCQQNWNDPNRNEFVVNVS